jgi:3-oxoacyl-[acyl-carrier protein] reductase
MSERMASPISLGGGVVITGAARGIGKAIAHRFASDGHVVVGLDLAGDDLRATIAGLPGDHHQAVVGDAADEAVLEQAADLAVKQGGRLHAFVANAGFAQPGDSLEFPLDAWERMLGIHVTAAFLGARVACRRMPTGGAIVMISSVNGHIGFGGRAAYCAAKAGVQGLVRSLAVEWAERGVRVNAVSPGSIATEMSLAMMKTGYASAEAFCDRIPMRRLGQPEEIADAVTFLASDRASYITGVVLPVDGGWLAYGLPAVAEPTAAGQEVH